MTDTDLREQRAARIRELYPELHLIQNAELRKKCVDAWVLAWELSGWERIEDVPLTGAVKKPLGVQHNRAVARLALAVYETFKESHNVELNRDYLIAGALLHDVAKPLEYAPAGQGSLAGNLLRHSMYGIHIALAVGLPLEIAQIIGGHSYEGQYVKRTPESTVIHFLDYLDNDPVFRKELGLSIFDISQAVYPPRPAQPHK